MLSLLERFMWVRLLKNELMQEVLIGTLEEPWLPLHRLILRVKVHDEYVSRSCYPYTLERVDSLTVRAKLSFCYEITAPVILEVYSASTT